MLRKLKSDGGTVVLITHKLDEVMEISDTVTVMPPAKPWGISRRGDASPRLCPHDGGA